MKLRPLEGSIGVEVTDLDVCAPGPAANIDALRRALAERHLLVVRGSDIAGEDQVAFVSRFGTLVAEHSLWGYVSNVRPDGIVREGALLFHSDFAFTATPVEVISLHPVELPPGGASTLFVDAVDAVRRMREDVRRRLVELRVVNVYDFTRPNDRPMRLAEAAPGSPSVEHPLIGRHPRTGDAVVMANELHTDHVVGLAPSESAALLAEVFAVLYDPGRIYVHRWEPGDLVLWDNVALHHGRRDIPRHEPRTLQRVVLGNYTPSELVPNLAELLAPSSDRSAP